MTVFSTFVSVPFYTPDMIPSPSHVHFEVIPISAPAVVGMQRLEAPLFTRKLAMMIRSCGDLTDKRELRMLTDYLVAMSIGTSMIANEPR